jgi:nucleoside-diphosphate-sugar epimerase
LHANLVGSVNMLEAATELGCNRLVLIGSGDQPDLGEAACSPYAAAKASQDIYAAMFHSLYGTPVTTARVFMTYGPDQPDESKLVPHVITSLLRGDPPPLSSGVRRCDWVYVDDVVDALVALGQAVGTDGQILEVGSGTLHSVREVVDSIVEAMETSVVPAWGAVPDRAHEVERAARLDAIRKHVGWHPSVDLATGVQRTASWYAARAVHGTRD